MRTDSVNLSQEATTKAAAYIEKEFGKDYVKIRTFKNKNSSAQEAHEAIRPTDLMRTPASLSDVLDPQQLKLYELIWKRTLASQMSEALVEITTFSFSPIYLKHQEWIAKGEVIQFEGFMKVYIESHDDDDEAEEGGILPEIKK